ncbi:MAG: hypothetical protein QGF68_12610 [Nitrospinota bacterium]|jgi:hypothetical protein|nr:hypothetical protein [Nitrospinota bacterium]MDP7385842.1 hypothetical protein [Nitrospinota bacterium]HJM42690.1 hypothetical protein [Nitrospinota bacterium]
MAETSTATEIGELRQALSVLHLDLLIHKGFSASARWKAERGVDVALPEFDAASRVLADTAWSDPARPAVRNLEQALAGYQKSIAAFDSTRENFFRTLLIDALWGLKEAIFGWPREHGV